MPRLASTLVFDRAARRLLVDGEEFPWFTSGGVEAVSDDGRGPTYVTITVPVTGAVEITGREDRR